MRRTAYFLLFGSSMMLAAACQSPETDHAAAEVDHAAAHEDAVHEDSAAHDALPLRPIMQQLGANMAGLTHALWVEDYGLMAVYADAIANHPHISGEEMQRIRAELGPEMDRFVVLDEAVHEASVRLHEAVESRDVEAILSRLGEVQEGCMACHTGFRQQLRTDRPAS